MTRLLFVSLLVASACATNGPTPGDDDAPTDNPDIRPTAGRWYYADSTAVHSSCNQPVQGENGEFAIDNVLPGSFHIIPNDGTTPFTCSNVNGTFDCPDRAWHTEDLRPGADAVVTVHGTATGTFSSSLRATGQQ